MVAKQWTLSPDRCFDANPTRRGLAQALYATVNTLPIIAPHGHVNPALLSDPEARFGSPAELLIIPDHYILRMLNSQGVSHAQMGVPSRDGSPVETNHRTIWQRFAENFHLFRGTPTGLWLADELTSVFGVTERLTGESAQRIYDHLEARLVQPDMAPRALFQRFNIELLATTDAASDPLKHHARLHADGYPQIRPTFRPDAVMNITAPDWKAQVEALSKTSGVTVVDYGTLIQALEQRRASFKRMGALATDHGTQSAYTKRLSDSEALSLIHI